MARGWFRQKTCHAGGRGDGFCLLHIPAAFGVGDLPIPARSATDEERDAGVQKLVSKGKAELEKMQAIVHAQKSALLDRYARTGCYDESAWIDLCFLEELVSKALWLSCGFTSTTRKIR